MSDQKINDQDIRIINAKQAFLAALAGLYQACDDLLKPTQPQASEPLKTE